VQRIENIFEPESSNEVLERAGVFLKNNDFFIAEVPEVFNLFLELIYFQVVLLFLLSQELCKLLLLLLRVGIFERDPGYKDVIVGVGSPLIYIELLRE
jgi:hypothetical protein